MNAESVLNKYFYFLIITVTVITVTMSVSMFTDSPLTASHNYFVPAPEYVRQLSGSFNSTIALLFFMQGAKELAYNSHEKVDLLLSLFSVAINLDPRLINAVFLGGMVLPATYEDTLKAIAFIEQAEELRPDEWRFPYWIGYNYIEIEEYEKAAKYYEKASELPGALPFLRYSPITLLAMTDTLEAAIIHTKGLLDSIDDEETQEWILIKLQWLHHMYSLEKLNRTYLEQTGEYPANLEELITAGLTSEIPTDDFGNGFYLAYPKDPEKGYMVRSR